MVTVDVGDVRRGADDGAAVPGLPPVGDDGPVGDDSEAAELTPPRPVNGGHRVSSVRWPGGVTSVVCSACGGEGIADTLEHALQELEPSCLG